MTTFASTSLDAPVSATPIDDSLRKSRRKEVALKDDAEPPEQVDCHPPDAHDSPGPSNPVRLGSPARVQHQRQPGTSDHESGGVLEGPRDPREGGWG